MCLIICNFTVNQSAEFTLPPYCPLLYLYIKESATKFATHGKWSWNWSQSPVEKNILNESRTGGGREFDSFLCPFKYKSQRLCILLTRGESLTTWWWILIFKRPRQQHSTPGNHSSSSSGGVIYYVLVGLKRRPSYVEKYPQLYYWYMQLINAYLMCHRGGGGTTCVCWGTRISYLLSPYDCDPVHVSVGKWWHYNSNHLQRGLDKIHVYTLYILVCHPPHAFCHCCFCPHNRQPTSSSSYIFVQYYYLHKMSVSLIKNITNAHLWSHTIECVLGLTPCLFVVCWALLGMLCSLQKWCVQNSWALSGGGV